MASTIQGSINRPCEMSATDAAYFAGFVDGEGTISLARTKRREGRVGYRFRPYFSVANCNVDVLIWLREACGNGAVVRKFSTSRHSPMRRESFGLTLGAGQMRAVLPVIRPYLRIKKRQAELLLEFLSISTHGRQLSDAEWKRVITIDYELKCLNRRGTGPIRPTESVVRPARWRNQWGALGLRDTSSAGA